ncbi:MAG: hypothetical protein DRN07_03895 [Thermoplasmata archaeon]|nr:MAG: hypothetical protein DRN07_03895 [Thermoplasmata archaeon]
MGASIIHRHRHGKKIPHVHILLTRISLFRKGEIKEHMVSISQIALFHFFTGKYEEVCMIYISAHALGLVNLTALPHQNIF